MEPNALVVYDANFLYSKTLFVPYMNYDLVIRISPSTATGSIYIEVRGVVSKLRVKDPEV